MKKEEIIKFIKYFCVGGCAAIVEWITFYLANLFFHFAIATIISFLISTYVNYILGRKIVFINHKKSTKEMASVFFVSGIGLGLNLVLMYLFVDLFHILELFSKIISTGIVFFWNYGSRRLLIYSEKNKGKQNEITEK